jgi:CoA-transferase family III
MPLVSGVGVPAGAVFDTMELQNDPNMEERGIMQTMHHPQHGDFKMPAWPVRVDGAPPRVLPAPMLGEHNAAVLSEWLGIESGEIEALHQEGILLKRFLSSWPPPPIWWGPLLFAGGFQATAALRKTNLLSFPHRFAGK